MDKSTLKRTAIEKIKRYIEFFKNYDGDVIPKRLVITDLQSVRRTLEKEVEEE